MRSNGDSILRWKPKSAGVSANTVRRGVREVEAGEGYTPGERQRKKGGGRKKESEKDATLLADLEGLLEPKGDPISLLKWTSKSVAHLKAALQAMGHTIADTALRDVLLSLGYSLRANKKTMEGNVHEDRDAQFAQIKKRCEQFEQAGHPIISVGCKKKELLAPLKTTDASGKPKASRPA
jgi:transposase